METAAHRDATVGGYGRGILLMLLAIGCFSTMTAMVKLLSDDYSVFQILFFRNMVPLPIVFTFLLMSGGLAAFRSRRPGLQVLRNSIAVVSNLCLFYALGRLALADATAIQFSSPLIVTALSALILRDHVGLRRWVAVVLGFLVVLFMVAPSGSVQAASFVLLLATFFYATMVVITRVLSKYDSVPVMFFYLTLIAGLVSGATMPWFWITPSGGDLLLLLMVGLFGSSAQFFLMCAIKVTPPAVIAPFEYTLMLWAVGFDILIWQAWPTAATLVGAAVIAGAGLYIAQRESQFASLLWTALRTKKPPA